MELENGQLDDKHPQTVVMTMLYRTNPTAARPSVQESNVRYLMREKAGGKHRKWLCSAQIDVFRCTVPLSVYSIVSRATHRHTHTPHTQVGGVIVRALLVGVDLIRSFAFSFACCICHHWHCQNNQALFVSFYNTKGQMCKITQWPPATRLWWHRTNETTRIRLSRLSFENPKS